ncbi:MAG: Bax inhibitor-1/YccA family protein [Rhodospirillales bacterium]|nr:Bax inhibitor-1/YccA family protein [Rhodospirillales bacterium]
MQPAHLSRERAQGREYDEGLRKYLSSIYLKMMTGVLLTGVVAQLVGSSPYLLELFLGGPQRFAVIFAPVAILWFGFNPLTMRSSQLMMAFYAISAAYGISFSAIAAVAAHDATFAIIVAKAFFIAASMFAGLSIYGYTTKTDFAPMRSLLVMGIWGVFIASILNIFFASGMMDYVISLASIVLFSGMTVWQTQDMKRMYYAVSGQEMGERLAWGAAYTLYVSFIALFMNLLNLMSNQR